jgi:hypothetical protein
MTAEEFIKLCENYVKPVSAWDRHIFEIEQLKDKVKQLQQIVDSGSSTSGSSASTGEEK